MSDKIKRVTPREIAEMLINEQAYQSTLFVLAEEHDAEIERLRARVEVLEDHLRRMIELDGTWNEVHAAIDAARAALEAKP